MPAGREGAFVEDGGVDVGVDGLSPRARRARVPPGLVEAMGVEEMEREQAGLVFRRPAGPRLERFPDACVELPPPAIGQALVRRVAGEHVPEAEGVAVVLHDEVAEIAPRLVFPRPVEAFL